MAMLENDIDVATYKASIDPEIYLTYAKKIEHDNLWHTYIEWKPRLEKQQGQAYAMVRGQCMEVLLVKNKIWSRFEKNHVLQPPTATCVIQ